MQNYSDSELIDIKKITQVDGQNFDAQADHDSLADPGRDEGGRFAGSTSSDCLQPGYVETAPTPQQTNYAQTRIKLNDAGVGNPESTNKPKMGGDIGANPLAMTNQGNVQTGASD